MKQEIETKEVIDLGSISVDTRGGMLTVLDGEGGKSIQAGLTDD